MPVLQDYTLQTIRDEIRTEFGGSTALNTEIDAKINQAVALIWSSLAFWRWSVHPFALNIAAQIVRQDGLISGATNQTLTWTSAISPSMVRREVVLGADTNRYVIVAHTAGTATATLDRPAVIIPAAPGVQVTFYDAYVELPADLAYVHRLMLPGTVGRRRIYALDPWAFIFEVENDSYAGSLDEAYYYAVVMDPLRTLSNEQVNRYYLTLWPRITTLTRLDGLYYSVPSDLNSNGDIAQIPRGYRRAIFFMACAFLAAKLRDWQAVEFYERQFTRMMGSLIQRNTLKDDDSSRLRSEGSVLPVLAPPTSVVVP